MFNQRSAYWEEIQFVCKKASKAGAKAGGASLADIRADIEATNSTDPEMQADLKCFWNKRPTPEEYIYKIMKKTKVKL